jgi:aryl-alcohol dehydrogenase-like predicted oxidoreductase
MQYVELGRSGLQVSKLALGSGGFWDRNSESARETIRTARERGVNFFDSARVYGGGRAEEVVGAALRDDIRERRDELVIATKGGLQMTAQGLRRDASPAQLRKDVEDSLVALDVEYIDLYHVHWPDPNVPVAESAGVLQQLVAEGKIRQIGLSNYDVELTEEFMKTAPVGSLQSGYHLFCRDIETNLLPFANDEDLGVAVYGALGHGFLSGTLTPDMLFTADDWRANIAMYHGEAFRVNLEVVQALRRLAVESVGCSLGQLAIAWVLTNVAVDVAILGTGRVDHLDEGIAALKISLDDDLLAEIDTIMEAAMPSPGPTPESTPFES